MDKIIEINFINKYIISEKKDRLIYEFSNPKKRENALLRFSHSIESIKSCLNFVFLWRYN